MSTRELAAVLPEAGIWAQFKEMRSQARFSQALLLVVPPDLILESFLDRVLAHLFCIQSAGPCGLCSMCLKILSDHHPDVQRIQPENPSGAIKIEQIRDLQARVYQTPQLSERQAVVIYPAEAMNQAAASSLLKILEEPPDSTIFLLVTTNPSLLLPTILSRCQQIHVQQLTHNEDILSLGKTYSETTARGALYAQRFDLFTQLDELFTRRLSPCDLAAQWSAHPFLDRLWFLSTTLSKLIELRLVAGVQVEPDYQHYALFTHAWCPEYLYDQLDHLYDIIKQVQQRINLNTTLVWERVFLNLLEGYSQC